MNELTAASLTIAGGVLVVVGGQLAVKLMIEPIHEQRRAIADVAVALSYYAYLYANPGVGRSEDLASGRAEFRRLAGQIYASTQGIKPYWLPRILRLSPGRDDVRSAYKNLIGLSNGMPDPKRIDDEDAARYGKHNLDCRAEIEAALGIGWINR